MARVRLLQTSRDMGRYGEIWRGCGSFRRAEMARDEPRSAPSGRGSAAAHTHLHTGTPPRLPPPGACAWLRHSSPTVRTRCRRDGWDAVLPRPRRRAGGRHGRPPRRLAPRPLPHRGLVVLLAFQRRAAPKRALPGHFPDRPWNRPVGVRLANVLCHHFVRGPLAGEPPHGLRWAARRRGRTAGTS